MAAAALAFSMLIYALLDGTDLGTGMLYAFHRREEDRHVMTLTLLPVWDGNETWLVLAGGGMLALFPAAYSIFFSALYVPAFAMLLALVLRGMSIEYRDHARLERRRLLDTMLMGGSAVAACAQGVMMGALIQGIPNDGTHYTGNSWEWFSVFPFFCGLALMSGYTLLGTCWLIWRTEQSLQARARRRGLMLGAVTLVSVIVLVLWTGALHPVYRAHLQQLRFTLPLGAVLLICAIGFCRLLHSRVSMLPLCMALGGVMASFGLLLLALYPAVIPPGLLIPQASAPARSQGFMLTGFALLIPVTLAYNTYGFWVFRGKVRFSRRASARLSKPK
nr:cytochrome d ubiquinol oxidase subunit II [Sodalis sp. dw_96]